MKHPMTYKLFLLVMSGLSLMLLLNPTAFAQKGQEKAEVSPWSLVNEQGTRDKGQGTNDQTAFTYQGQLKDANGPVTGTFDFQFVLYSAQTGGEQLGVSEMEDVALTNGMFSFKLDFGRAAVEAKESWLEIGVRQSGSTDAYTILFPRQKLTPTPYAIFAQHEQWGLIGVPVGFADRTVIPEGAPAVIEAGDTTKPKEDKSPNTDAQAAAAPQGTANFIAKFDGAGNPTANSVMFDNGTNVGIGTTNPTSRLEIAAQDGLKITGFQPFLTLRDSNARNARGVIQSVSGGMNLFTESYLSGANPFAYVSLNNSGNVGIGSATPASKLDIVAQDALGLIGYQPFLTLKDSNAGYARSRIQGVNGGMVLETESYISGANPTGFIVLQNSGNVGIGTATPQAKLDVAGMAKVGVLQITGGGDLAEPFEITDASSIQSGMVVAIDPARPGHLRMADKPYDRTVAGIISGANGINPGLTMKQQGTVADGAHPVALAGRVYCWADASYGSIEPGDLLTTSDTPGHAMKVTDHAQAQGAIIGKAMTELKRGKGLVLVLVTLQ